MMRKFKIIKKIIMKMIKWMHKIPNKIRFKKKNFSNNYLILKQKKENNGEKILMDS